MTQPQWCRGHSRVWGNDVVHALAKIGSTTQVTPHRLQPAGRNLVQWGGSELLDRVRCCPLRDDESNMLDRLPRLEPLWAAAPPERDLRVHRCVHRVKAVARDADDVHVDRYATVEGHGVPVPFLRDFAQTLAGAASQFGKAGARSKPRVDVSSDLVVKLRALQDLWHAATDLRQRNIYAVAVNVVGHAVRRERFCCLCCCCLS